MKLVDLLPKESISTELKSRTKNGIIRELLELLARSSHVRDINAVSESIFEREHSMSTGIGSGVAIPHGKSSGIVHLCASLGIIKEGVDFNSIDKKPTYIFFLLAGPEGPPGPHIKALSRISRMLNKSIFREKLLQCNTPEEVVKSIEEEEKDYFEM